MKGAFKRARYSRPLYTHLQPLRENFHVQEPQEAAAEAGAERRRLVAHHGDAAVVEAQTVHRCRAKQLGGRKTGSRECEL